MTELIFYGGILTLIVCFMVEYQMGDKNDD